MPTFSSARESNASYNPPYVPVMVITGATSGIGKAITELFARNLRGRVHIVLVGRNKATAEALISTLPPPVGNGATYEFVACDVTLMKNVRALATDLRQRLPKVNFLVHCAGVFGLRGREETSEGIDRKLASRYYARWVLTHSLIPLLKNAADLQESASVLAIQGAGKAPQVDLTDLGLKRTYTGFKAMMQSIAYNDLMVAEFAKREPEIAFTHIYPGTVDTGMLQSSNVLLKIVRFLLFPLIWLFITKTEVCAEHMLFALLDAKKGMYRRDNKGDNIGLKRFPAADAEGAQEMLWEHTERETEGSRKEE